jgi:hypothetical protein
MLQCVRTETGGGYLARTTRPKKASCGHLNACGALDVARMIDAMWIPFGLFVRNDSPIPLRGTLETIDHGRSPHVAYAVKPRPVEPRSSKSDNSGKHSWVPSPLIIIYYQEALRVLSPTARKEATRPVSVSNIPGVHNPRI